MPVGSFTGHGMGSPDKPAHDDLRAQRKHIVIPDAQRSEIDRNRSVLLTETKRVDPGSGPG